MKRRGQAFEVARGDWLEVGTDSELVALEGEEREAEALGAGDGVGELGGATDPIAESEALGQQGRGHGPGIPRVEVAVAPAKKPGGGGAEDR